MVRSAMVIDMSPALRQVEAKTLKLSSHSSVPITAKSQVFLLSTHLSRDPSPPLQQYQLP